MDANLLYQKHMGFNPRSGKNEPNRLYLADLEVTAKDVYIKREPIKSPKPLGTSGLLKKRQDLDYTNRYYRYSKVGLFHSTFLTR